MKLLFVTRYFGSYAGGADKSLQFFLNMFVKSENTLRLIIENQNDEVEITTLSKDFILIKVPKTQFVAELKKQVELFQPDFIGSQRFWSPETFMALRNIRIPKMYFKRGSLSLLGKNEEEFIKMTNIDLLIANSSYVKQLIYRTYKRKALLSYPLIDLNQYLVKKNSKKYITLINYQKEKGSEIFDNIAKKMPQQKFLAIRGWMPLDQKQRKEIHGNITIAGPYKDMRRVYSQTKILLIPSIWPEPAGRVFMEAAINGIPSIASDVGGIREWISGGGVIIKDYKNVNRWIKEIKKFNDVKYYREMSLRAKQRANQYSAQKEYEKIVNSMENILQKRETVLYKIWIYLRFLYLRTQRFAYFRLTMSFL